MAQFKPAKITSQGQMMMMQDLNNEIDLQFTRIAFGNGTYTSEEYASITARTALKSQKQSFNINSMGIISRTSLVLGVVADNTNLAEGYRMTEVGLFAKDGSDPNATEELYAIVIADTQHVVHYKTEEVYDENRNDYVPMSTDEIDYEEDVVLADYMPAYNGTSAVRIRQNFQVDVVDASTVTISVVDSAVVALSYLEEFYYNKVQTDELLAKKMNYEVLDTISTLSALNEIATNTDYKNGNYMLLIPVTSGNIIANLDLYIPETAIMTFYGEYVILRFPYNNKTFRYSESVTYNWARVYADVDPADTKVAAMINARHPKPKHLYMGTALANVTVARNSAVSDQMTNNAVGRLYISGTDFIEYVDLETTENVEVVSQTEPSDNFYIQTWHQCDGSILQRTKIGDSGTPSAWAEISATTAT